MRRNLLYIGKMLAQNENDPWAILISLLLTLIGNQLRVFKIGNPNPKIGSPKMTIVFNRLRCHLSLFIRLDQIFNR